MGRILVASTPLAGHVNPMLLVAESLSRQGHDVYFHTAEVFREKVETAGLRFLPLLGNANYDYRKMGEVVPELRTAAAGIDQANAYVKYLFGDRIPDQHKGLQLYIEAEKIDLVLTEVAFLGVLPLLLQGEMRPPVISCGVIAPVWDDPAFSCLTGPDRTPEGVKRNIEDNRQMSAWRAPGYLHIDAVLAKLGTGIPGGYQTNICYRAPDLFLQFGAEVFEYPMLDRPENLHFTGPILPPHLNDVEAPAWLQTLDSSKPAIFVTQGTLANFDFDQLVNPALEALENDDVQVIVTAGGGNRNAIRAAAHTMVETYLPYEFVLPKTSVFITNGGYNGVQHALSYGVPVMSAGISEDKRQVAARINWSGAGIGLLTASPTAAQIYEAVSDILRDPRYRNRARALGESLKKTDALTTIASFVDKTLNEGSGNGNDRYQRLLKK